MVKYKGYMNKILRINLSDQSYKIEKINDNIIIKYIGGKGLAARYFFKEVPPKTNPLSSDNKLMIASGPFQGTMCPLSGRFVIYTKSPLTNTICDSYSGGKFCTMFKYAGYDMLIIEGKSNKPIYINIYNNEIDFIPAEHLWGKGTHETEDIIHKELNNNKATIASIGPAGEKLVKYASIINEKHNAAARGGVGAVMGSKNLKAIAVYGSNDVGIYNSKEFLKARKGLNDPLMDSDFSEEFGIYGTTLTVEATNNIGIYPTNNFQEGVFKDFEKIGGDAIRENLPLQNKGCFGCILQCNKTTEITTSKNEKIMTDRQEYETLFALGGNVGNKSLTGIIEGGHICNDLGIDTISAGVTISFAMELYEKDYINAEDIGYELKFGDTDAVLKMLEDISFRRGFGDILAEGSKLVSEKYGKETEFFAIHVKGMEIPGYDPRGAKGMGIAYATANRGACHNYAYTIGEEMWTQTVDRFEVKNKGEMVIDLQNLTAASNSTILCKFPFDNVIWTLDQVSNMVNAITGMNLDASKMNLIGERIYNLERLYNLESGLTINDDTLPGRFLYEKMTKGPSKNEVCELEPMLEEYLKLRNWNFEDGWPCENKLEELGILKLYKEVKKEW
jgi:aldehyde:ferredoxin oxidoreductase